MLLALSGFRLEELADPKAPGLILQAVRRETGKLRRAENCYCRRSFFHPASAREYHIVVAIPNPA